MWQPPSKSRLRNLKSQREHPRRSIHIKRVTADICSVGNPTPEGRPGTEGSARILLNDLSIKGVGIFCTQPFKSGQEIAIQLTDPIAINLRGKIVHCQEHEGHAQVISSLQYSYRIGIQFIFANETEEAAVRAFCEEIFKDLNPE